MSNTLAMIYRKSCLLIFPVLTGLIFFSFFGLFNIATGSVMSFDEETDQTDDATYEKTNRLFVSNIGKT